VSEPTGPAPAPGAEPLPQEGHFVTLPNGRRVFVRPVTPYLVPASEASAVHPHANGGDPPPPSPPERPEPAFDSGASRVMPELTEGELQEIVSIVPGALVRWGITAITAVTLILVVIAAVVRYPVVIGGAATVTTPEAPVRLSAPVGGEIQSLLARDGQAARAGDVLAVLRNPADYRSVLAMRGALEASAQGEFPALGGAGRGLGSLGDIMLPAAAYEAARAELAAHARDPLGPGRAASLQTQMERQRALYTSAVARIRLLESDTALAGRERMRSREMVARQLLSPAEGEKAETAYLAKLQALESGRNEVLTQQMRIADLERSLLEVSQSRIDEGRKLRQDAEKALAALREAVGHWETRYLLRAPVAGRVSFFRRLAEGQYVAPGDPVIAVVPHTGRPVALVRVSDHGIGRVRPGQRVIFRFFAYPYQEYGTVQGVVRGLSLVANEPAAHSEGRPEYLVRVDLPHGLTTNQGTRLPLRQEMAARAEIVAENQSVLQRLLAQFTRGAR